MTTPKINSLELIQRMPEDSTYDDCIEQLFLLMKVERALQQAERGEVLTAEQVRAKLSRWLPK